MLYKIGENFVSAYFRYSYYYFSNIIFRKSTFKLNFLLPLFCGSGPEISGDPIFFLRPSPSPAQHFCDRRWYLVKDQTGGISTFHE